MNEPFNILLYKVQYGLYRVQIWFFIKVKRSAEIMLAAVRNEKL